jgi:hypothetical protein
MFGAPGAMVVWTFLVPDMLCATMPVSSLLLLTTRHKLSVSSGLVIVVEATFSLSTLFSGGRWYAVTIGFFDPSARFVGGID